jgi:hypothetical protein
MYLNVQVQNALSISNFLEVVYFLKIFACCRPPSTSAPTPGNWCEPHCFVYSNRHPLPGAPLPAAVAPLPAAAAPSAGPSAGAAAAAAAPSVRRPLSVEEMTARLRAVGEGGVARVSAVFSWNWTTVCCSCSLVFITFLAI